MRRFVCVIILLCLIVVSNKAFAGNSGNSDTIINMQGKALSVTIIKVTDQYVRYALPNADALSTILCKDIQKIIYSNGRVVDYNVPADESETKKPVVINKPTILDTIIKVEGKVLPVNVVKVTEQYVRFMVPGNTEVFTVNRKDIHRIIYGNGRIEEYSALAVNIIEDDAWQSVWLTEDQAEVVSLYKRGEIKAQSPPSSRSPAAAKKGAIIRLQKKASAMNGSVVLVTKKQATGGYGEFPGYFIEGIVYGTEPLEEGEAPKKDFDVIQ